jgi:hypothetical protein
MGSIIKRDSSLVGGGKLKALAGHWRDTFAAGTCQPGIVPAGTLLYRYGTTRNQAADSHQDWVNLSLDRYETSDEAIQALCLLDVTAHDLGEPTGTPHPLNPSATPPAGAGGSWNVAAFRACFAVATAVPVWYGDASAMAFDLRLGKRYRGAGDMTPHMTRPGGGSQVLVNKSLMGRLKIRPGFVELRRTQYLH